MWENKFAVCRGADRESVSLTSRTADEFAILEPSPSGRGQGDGAAEQHSVGTLTPTLSQGEREQISLRVIEAINGQIITGQLRAAPKIENGRIVSDIANDVLKIALVDRYSGGAPAIGFIKNFGLKQGAIASTVSHDSHNLLAVGVDDQSIARAMNLLIGCQGGISAVGQLDGKPVEAVLPLPIAGLMSPAEGSHVAHEYSRIDALAKKLGTKLSAPYMTLSFMALLVIPELKLGPEGMFDVGKFQPVSLWE